jgi:midasin (ATPase involved in ribosome maturation)
MISFIVDTSSFLSLESASLLDNVLNKFKVITSDSVLNEIRDFTVHDDELGKIAKRVLQKKSISFMKPRIKEELAYVSQTDNDIFNLALSKRIPLVTDDIKLAKHAKNKVHIEFSTYFLSVFIEAKLLTTSSALQKLEQMRVIRGWQNNIIYILTKEKLTTFTDKP